MRCGTLFQCFNFLARHNGTISLAENPDDPTQTRCVIKIDGKDDELLAALTYPCTEEMNLLEKAIIPTCRALAEQLEGD